MSIGHLQELFKSKGCQVLLGVVAIIVLLVMVLPSAMPGLNFFNAPQPGQAMVAKIGSKAITEADLTEQMRLAERQMGPSLGVQQEALKVAASVFDLVQRKAIETLVEERKVEVSEAAILAYLDRELEREIKNTRQAFIQEGKLKADATDQQFIELFKKERGMTPDEMKKQQVSQVETMLKDPEQAKLVMNSAGRFLLLDNIQSTMKVSDEELKATYDTLSVKQIVFGDLSQPIEEREKKAEEALKEIRGGAKFEDVQKKYMPEDAGAPIEIRRDSVRATPGLEPLAELKKGEVSDVLMQFGMPTIYYVVDVKQKLPADFEKQKETYRTQVIAQRAQSELEKQIKEVIEKRSEWYSPVVKGFYDYAAAQSDPSLMGNMTKTRDRMKEIEKIAISRIGVNETNFKPGDGWAQLLRFAAQSAYFNMLTPQEQSAMRTERLEAINGVLENTEYPMLRLEAYELLLAEGNQAEAVEQLVSAVGAVAFDEAGTQVIEQVKSKVAAAEAQKKIDADSLKVVKDALANWNTEKAAFEKEQKELKAEEERLQREAEAERKRLEEEMKREEAAGNAPANAPSNTSANSPASTGGP